MVEVADVVIRVDFSLPNFIKIFLQLLVVPGAVELLDCYFGRASVDLKNEVSPSYTQWMKIALTFGT
jgi:hypothetical protein